MTCLRPLAWASFTLALVLQRPLTRLFLPLASSHTPTPILCAHLQVEVHGVEYCYGGGGGIIHHRPRAPPSGAAPGQQASTPFRVQLLIGEVEATSSEVQRVVDSLRGTWLGSEYHLLTRNCNCFADELSTRLCGKRIPGYVNRLAGLGVYFSCLLPPNMRPPVSSTSNSNSSSGGSSNSSSSGAAAVGRVLGGGGARSSSSDAAMGGGGGGGWQGAQCRGGQGKEAGSSGEAAGWGGWRGREGERAPDSAMSCLSRTHAHMYFMTLYKLTL